MAIESTSPSARTVVKAVMICCNGDRGGDKEVEMTLVLVNQAQWWLTLSHDPETQSRD